MNGKREDTENMLHNEFEELYKDCLDRHGWTIPEATVNYIVALLAERVDRVPWEPEPSYAEQYLQIRTRQQALDLGNTCFWCRSVFPTYKSSRGYTPEYMALLGQSCYDRVLKEVEIQPLVHLRDYWEFLAEVTYTAVWSQGGYRTMWQD